ncbi:hypothetical protein KIMH_06520 [Bombiscardovia apis]|uniref:Uncharacterized protein n=1 Tax=Bombiscardovia apis TaxID=2932182 RepID=A0ABM8BC96_9BIFI|nr:hypothetical protein KIMH_06520 [Bombiscardovia apis]
MNGKVVTASSGTVPTKIAPELQAYADKLGGLGVKNFMWKYIRALC